MNVAHVLLDSAGGGGTYVESLTRSATLDITVVTRSGTFLAREAAKWPSRVAYDAIRHADIVNFHGIRSAVECGWIPVNRSILTSHGLHTLQEQPTAWRQRFSRGIAVAALKSCDHIICVSESDHTLLTTSTNVDNRATVVTSGVASRPLPTDRERQAARAFLEVPVGSHVMLFVGGLRYQKDPELAMAAVRLALKRLPDLILLVAGDGPLRNALMEADVDQRIRLLGDRDDVPMLFTAADAVLNTSRWEGLSLALLEGLWFGCPIIAVDAPGNAEAVGNAGRLVSERTASAVSEAIVAHFTSDNQHELRRIARTRAEAHFDERTMIDRTIEVYEAVLGEADLVGTRP